MTKRQEAAQRSTGTRPESSEGKRVQLVERTVINERDPRYAAIDAAAFASKNLWNAANYLVRQAFIHEQVYLDNVNVYHLIKSHEAYKALPAKVSNQVLIQLHRAWVAFFEAMEEWREDPSKFLGRPKLPGYKDKAKGRNLLVYEKGAISKRALKRGKLAPSGLGIEVPTRQVAVKQARIVPRHGYYVVEVIYEQAVEQAAVNPEYYAGIDIGMHVLAALRVLTSQCQTLQFPKRRVSRKEIMVDVAVV